MRLKDPLLAITEIADLVIRRNFEQLRDYFDKNGQLDSFKLLEITVTSNGANTKIDHNLGYIPKDVIVTRLLAPTAATFTVNHGKNTEKQLDITVAGLATNESLTVRLFLGSYKGDSSTVILSDTAKQEYKH